MSKQRPILPNLVVSGTTEIETFQNTTLRPIIKMQHDILLKIFNEYLEKKKIDIVTISKEKRNEKIANILQKDQLFKKLIIGCVVGHFSKEELSSYFKNENEFNKRIIGIITKRFQDSI